MPRASTSCAARASDALPEDERFELNLPEIAEVWRRGSVVSSWLLDLTAQALGQRRRAGQVHRRRWTTAARAAGPSRRRSRRRCRPTCWPARSSPASARARTHTFGEKMLSAMRFGFGGHVEQPGGNDAAERRCRRAFGTPGAPKAPALRDGDLRRRRRPGQAAADAGHLQPARGSAGRRLQGRGRRSRLDIDDARLPAVDLGGFLHGLAKDKDAEFGKSQHRRRQWTWLADRIFYQKGDLTDDATYAGPGQAADRGQAARTPRAVLRGRRAALLRRHRRAPRQGGPAQGAGRRLPAGGRGKAVRRRPRLGQGAEPAHARVLDEDQIYRIDHFLGKETVHNIMVTRFGNGVFEPMWNRLHIDHVQITAAETVNVEQRGGYYDKSRRPARHDAQPPVPAAGDGGHGAAQLLRRRRRARRKGPGDRGHPAADAGRGARGFRARPVPRRKRRRPSRWSPTARPRTSSATAETETYVALKLEVDNWRWAGVPFYLRTGKALSAHDTSIAIQFKAAPQTLFQNQPGGGSSPNVLILKIQPHEGIRLLFDAKRPGPNVSLADVCMTFNYADFFSREARDRLRDPDLRLPDRRPDPVQSRAGHRVRLGRGGAVPRGLEARRGRRCEFYEAGTAGPKGADALLERDGRAWRRLPHE